MHISTIRACAIMGAATSALLLLAGCESNGWTGIRGSGVLATETRSVEPFHSVDLSGTGAIRLRVGEPGPLKVSGDDNILPIWNTETQNGVLRIWHEGAINTKLPLTAEGAIQDVRELRVTGAGDFEVRGIDGGAPLVEITGSADIKLTGSAGQLTIKISGSGDVAAEELRVAKAIVKISGSGNANIFVTDELDVTINGSGDVAYRGDPANVNSRVSGSGDVTKVE